MKQTGKGDARCFAAPDNPENVFFCELKMPDSFIKMTSSRLYFRQRNGLDPFQAHETAAGSYQFNTLRIAMSNRINTY
jgi:hypothetical protein